MKTVDDHILRRILLKIKMRNIGKGMILKKSHRESIISFPIFIGDLKSYKKLLKIFPNIRISKLHIDRFAIAKLMAYSSSRNDVKYLKAISFENIEFHNNIFQVLRLCHRINYLSMSMCTCNENVDLNLAQTVLKGVEKLEVVIFDSKSISIMQMLQKLEIQIHYYQIESKNVGFTDQFHQILQNLVSLRVYQLSTGAKLNNHFSLLNLRTLHFSHLRIVELPVFEQIVPRCLNLKHLDILTDIRTDYMKGVFKNLKKLRSLRLSLILGLLLDVYVKNLFRVALEINRPIKDEICTSCPRITSLNIYLIGDSRTVEILKQFVKSLKFLSKFTFMGELQDERFVEDILESQTNLRMLKVTNYSNNISNAKIEKLKEKYGAKTQIEIF